MVKRTAETGPTKLLQEPTVCIKNWEGYAQCFAMQYSFKGEVLALDCDFVIMVAYAVLIFVAALLNGGNMY